MVIKLNPAVPKPTTDLTLLLRSWGEGDSEAEAELWPIVYNELRSLAKMVLIGRRRVRGSGTTTLVHEAYLRLLGGNIHWNDRRHFFAVAARAMRFVLVDEARKRTTEKRSAEEPRAEVPEDVADPLALRAHEVLHVHQALERLAELNPRHVRLVELRFFAGLSLDETAEIMDVSRPTVVRDWKAARAWLHGELQAS